MVNNKDNNDIVIDNVIVVVLMSFLLPLIDLAHWSGVSIVDTKQINASWVRSFFFYFLFYVEIYNSSIKNMFTHTN